MLAPVAHQRRIREQEAARDPRPAMATLEGCTVEQIAYAEAKALIIRYEWLRTMPTVTRACYGLRTPSGELAGVAVFAAGPAPESGDLCGREHRDRAICLARGACVHWAHPHAASFLISRACKLAAGPSSAGKSSTPIPIRRPARSARSIRRATGSISARASGAARAAAAGGSSTGVKADGARSALIRRRGLKPADLRSHPDWIADFTPDKGRYVWFEGTPAREARSAAGAEIRAEALSEAPRRSG